MNLMALLNNWSLKAIREKYKATAAVPTAEYEQQTTYISAPMRGLGVKPPFFVPA